MFGRRTLDTRRGTDIETTVITFSSPWFPRKDVAEPLKQKGKLGSTSKIRIEQLPDRGRIANFVMFKGRQRLGHMKTWPCTEFLEFLDKFCNPATRFSFHFHWWMKSWETEYEIIAAASLFWRKNRKEFEELMKIADTVEDFLALAAIT